jgi:hypothetical protein
MPTSTAHNAALTDSAFARLGNARAILPPDAGGLAGRDKTESFRTRASVSGNFRLREFWRLFCPSRSDDRIRRLNQC